MSSNILIRVNFIIDKDSKSFPSEREWLKHNDNNKYSLYSVIYEIHENYPALVASIKTFRHVNIARRMSEERGLSKILSYLRWDVNLDHKEEPFGNGNIIDLYLNHGENCYYLDRECSNAAVLIFTNPLFSLVKLRDRILESFNVKAYRDGEMLLIDCGRESHDVVIGRMRRIAALCLFQMGVPADHHMINDKFISYVDDNKGLNAIYIY